MEETNAKFKEDIQKLQEEAKVAQKYRTKVEKVLKDATHALSLTLSVRITNSFVYLNKSYCNFK